MIATRVAEPQWMRALRSQARERFEEMRWPTLADEEWRRTDIAGIDPLSYGPREAEDEAVDGEAESSPSELSIPDGVAGIIRFEAGKCIAHGLRSELREMGVRLLSLKSALEEYEDQLAPIFQGSLLAADNRFAAWHASAWSHGVFLSVPPFVETEDLFVIEFIESGNWMLTSPRVVVFLGDGSRATVMQRTRSSRDEEELLCNSGLELKAGDGAALRYVEGQALGKRSLHFRHSRAELGRDASLRHLDVTIGGRLVKTRFDCGLNGAGAEAFLDGAYFCGQGQHMDLRTVQRHRAPSAMSRATYKGAIDSGGRTVFQGLIEVSEGASGTDAYLSNRNLILGDAARADSIPTLQIGNNDVRCSHGSTTGQLREEEIFYLVSRGLSPRDARELLVIGYFEEILNAAPPSFSEDALAAIRARLLQ